MRYICEPDAMRAAEKNAGVPSLALMERAARAVFCALPPAGRVAFACGGGMNGGDGFGAAAMYAENGGEALVWRVPEESDLRGDAREEYARCVRAGARIFAADALDDIPLPDAWTDALLGIGLNRPVEGVYARGVRRMARDRAQGARVIAADIPSGVCGVSGATLGEAVRADETVTFGWAKPGHFLGQGYASRGALTVADIGVAADETALIRLAEARDARAMLPCRARDSHKGTYGHLLVWAGSEGMAGAACITALAALRGGAGLVSVACPEKIVPIVQTVAPCAVCVPLPEDAVAARETLREALRGKSAVAAGPGLSLRADAGMLSDIMTCGLPAVLDADALNCIARHDGLRALLSDRHAVTPHPGEAARLLGRPCEDPLRDCRALAGMGCAALLKGATSVICGQSVTLSASGTPGMAKGGSGDALTGLVGALLAQGLPPEDALWVGSELHGLAGENAARRKGVACMLATDLIECMGEAFAL